MTYVTLDLLWLAPAEDLTDMLAVRLNGLSSTPAVVGEIRRYAQGRTRLILRDGTLKEQHAVTLTKCSRADARQIKAWAGRLLSVRDPTGAKFWGTYFQPKLDFLPEGTVNVTFTINEVTFDEAV